MKKQLLAATALALVLSAGSAHAADMRPVFKAPPPPPMWSGFYAGLNLGWAWGRNEEVACPIDNEGGSHACFTSPPSEVTSLQLQLAITSRHPSGVIGGGQFGYNLQFGPVWVLGFEVDFQGVGAGDTTSSAITGISISKNTNWLGTARLRAGVTGALINPSLLFYGTAGLAYGGVDASVSGHSIGNYSDTRVGWIAGGGVEWRFLPNASVKGEVLYYDLGRASFATSTRFGTVGVTDVHYDGVIARVGFNYFFDLGNWGKAPIRAGY